MPPMDRAKRFMSPKSDATIPAFDVERSNSSEKYVAAMLFIVSSTPKHAAYWPNINQELTFTYPCSCLRVSSSTTKKGGQRSKKRRKQTKKRQRGVASGKGKQVSRHGFMRDTYAHATDRRSRRASTVVRAGDDDDWW